MDEARVETELGKLESHFFDSYHFNRSCYQRIVYIQSIPAREQSSMGSGYTTSGSRSGYQTPRELKEEQWRLEANSVNKPSKNELREMYKELGGRKSKTKGKVGSTGRIRDKGGLGISDDC